MSRRRTQGQIGHRNQPLKLDQFQNQSLSYFFAGFCRRMGAAGTSLVVTAVAEIEDCCKSSNQSVFLSINFER